MNLTNFTNVSSIYDFINLLNSEYPLALLFLIPTYVTILFLSSQKMRFQSAFLLTNFAVTVIAIPLVILQVLDILYEWFLILVTAISVIVVWREVRE